MIVPKLARCSRGRPPRAGVMLLGLALVALLGALPGAGTARAQISRLLHPDTTAGNFFGVAVALDDDRAVIGASGEHGCGENSGAAYVYERDAATNTWHKTTRLSPKDCKGGIFFGRSVALSGDRVLVAAAETFFGTGASNAVYVFERDPTTGTWHERAKLTADPDAQEGAFATSVSLDGDRALITTSGDPTGQQYAGTAYVFERDPRTNTWRKVARLKGSGGRNHGIFGGAGVLDGDRIAVAASTYFRGKPGSVYVFERDPAAGTWKEAARIGGIRDFFISLDLDGDRLLIGESKGGHRQSGAAVLYTRDASGAWSLTETLHPRTPYDHGAFGSEVSLHGDRALVVGYDEQLGFSFNIDRVVYAFCYDREAGIWRQERIIDIGEVAFGAAVDHEGAIAVIGQSSEQQPGAAYIVRLP